jgi:hypothetical protein
MFGVLEKVLRGDRIVAGMGMSVARQLKVFLRQLLRAAPHLDVGAIGLIGRLMRVGLATAIR